MTHVQLAGLTCKAMPVNYLPELKTFIFCDGDYWHDCPNGKLRDSKEIKYLQSKGFNAYRFWEHDILNNCNKLVEELK